MESPLSLTVPLPPSVNHYWRSVPATRNRRALVLISEEGRRFKARCRLVAQAQCPAPLAGEVSMRAVVYFRDRRRDLDNVLKPLLDALQGIVYHDDRQIVHLDFHKRLDPKHPRIEMEVALSPSPSSPPPCAPSGSGAAGPPSGSGGRPTSTTARSATSRRAGT